MWSKCTNPAVEQLERFASAGDMGAQIGDDHIAKLIHKHEPHLRLAVHHFLGTVVALGGSAFD
ncbi:hypothetical protein D3C86_2202920 [compost metagenome]